MCLNLPQKQRMVLSQMAGEAISAMNDVADLCQDSDSDGPSLEELVSSLNSDQVCVYGKVNSHLEHQIMHECGCCQCSDLMCHYTCL